MKPSAVSRGRLDQPIPIRKSAKIILRKSCQLLLPLIDTPEPVPVLKSMRSLVVPVRFDILFQFPGVVETKLLRSIRISISRVLAYEHAAKSSEAAQSISHVKFLQNSLAIPDLNRVYRPTFSPECRFFIPKVLLRVTVSRCASASAFGIGTRASMEARADAHINPHLLKGTN